MRISRPAFLLFLCYLIPASLPAQQSTSTAPAAPQSVSDPQAVALIQRALLALTGGAPITDVTLTGTARRIAGSDDETGTATLKATSLGDSRVDLSLPSGNRTEIRNHFAVPRPGSLPSAAPIAAAQAMQPVGAWSGPDGTLRGIANHNTMTDGSWFFPAGTITRIIATQGYVLAFIGSEDLNGEQVIHIRASQPLTTTVQAPPGVPALMQHLSQMGFYLNSTTLLPVALEFDTHPDANALLDIPTRIEFSGYQGVNGVQVPFRVQKFLNNGLVLDLQLSTVSLNSGLTAAAFEIQ